MPTIALPNPFLYEINLVVDVNEVESDVINDCNAMILNYLWRWTKRNVNSRTRILRTKCLGMYVRD